MSVIPVSVTHRVTLCNRVSDGRSTVFDICQASVKCEEKTTLPCRAPPCRAAPCPAPPIRACPSPSMTCLAAPGHASTCLSPPRSSSPCRENNPRDETRGLATRRMPRGLRIGRVYRKAAKPYAKDIRGMRRCQDIKKSAPRLERGNSGWRAYRSLPATLLLCPLSYADGLFSLLFPAAWVTPC